MIKYDLIRKKRDEMRNRRLVKINRRTFTPRPEQIFDLGDLVVHLPIVETDMII